MILEYILDILFSFNRHLSGTVVVIEWIYSCKSRNKSINDTFDKGCLSVFQDICICEYGYLALQLISSHFTSSIPLS